MRNLPRDEVSKCEDIIKQINGTDPEEEIFKKCPRAKITKWKKLWEEVKSYHSRRLKFWKNQINTWTGASKLILENKNPIVDEVYYSFKRLYKGQIEWINSFLEEMRRLEMIVWEKEADNSSSEGKRVNEEL